ncbi:MAG: helicase-exonuclease AddAB subunit AddA [Coprococcus sp.]
MGFEWTEEQQAVINTRQRSVLVSAAAGSGKTAVLVERLIRLLTDEEHPVKIEKLLVVTFTNAAAAEMRERIGRGLEQRLQEHPGNSRWLEQKLLLPCAQISTIHSLCLKLIRQHFDVLDIDPSFRLGDEAELKLLKADVASDVMEVYYASGNTAFRNFVERYASGRSDQGIAEMIVRLYDYSRGFPWPDYWLEQCCHQYDPDNWRTSDHPVLIYGMEQLRALLQKFYPMLDEAERLCNEVDGPGVYLAVVQSDRQWLDKLNISEDYEEVRSVLQQISWKRLSRTSASVSEYLKEEVKSIHTELKNELNALREDFFSESEEDLRAEMAYILPSVEMLCELVKSFAAMYQEEKRDRNMMDYSDLEHCALKLLVNFYRNEDGSMGIEPTSVANELSEFYEEVVCDEYQDSNQVQEMIMNVLSGERFGHFNRFMVGDVKQSIYRFRMADAAIFMEKYNRFSSFRENGSQARIDLHQNFRSRAYVLESINFFFRQMMTREMGGIVYDDKAALNPGMVYPDAEGYHVACRTEFLLIAPDEQMSDEEEAELSAVEIEAKAVAVKIHELTDPVHGVDIYDGNLGCYRRAGYKDIVILLRTVSGWAETFVEIMGQENIPVSAELSEGFFDTLEIRTMTEFLSVVDNPGQDIPLTAVLKSPIVGMSSEELAMIRSSSPEGSLYSACLCCRENIPGYEKLETFLNLLSDIREAAGYMELYELIQYIYDKTGYYDYAQALPGGQRRRANLDLLTERAVSYASGSYSGLFNFVRYIEQLKNNNIDFGEAAIPEDGKGRVNIISVHKSKGLEYPIVILAGMGKKINFQDASGNLVIHPEYGIGLDAVNLQNRKKKVSVYKKFISKQIIRDTLAEELRILYVAMTRAKEKLIMTGMLNGRKTDDQLKTWYRASSEPGEVLPDWALTGARSYLDWLMPCLMKTDAMEFLMKRRNLPFTHREDEKRGLFIVRAVDIRSLLGREVKRTMKKQYYEEELLLRKVSSGKAELSAVGELLQQDGSWQYPGQALLSVRGKYTVSELKKDQQDEGEILFGFDRGTMSEHFEDSEEMPDFMKESEDIEECTEEVMPVGGAFRGTAYHRVLELLDFGSCPESISIGWLREQLLSMVDSRRLSKAQYDRINLADICDLVCSDLGRRMETADRKHLLKREVQFIMGVPVSMIYPELQNNERVVIQGIIDAYFEENGKLILIDYKTDRVPKEGGADILRQRYSRQLDYYQYALEQMTGKKVAERLIYSFALKETIFA